MLNYIWSLMIIISILYSIFTGTSENLTNLALTSASEAIELIITMTGTVCLWSGLTEIADKSGLGKAISKLMSPLLSKLFPGIDKESAAFSAISANVTANLLGLGNAATPLGIKAMQELAHEGGSLRDKHTATSDMIMFVILNTTSFQFMPTMIISILNSHGSSSPMEIVPYVWAASLCGLAVGIISVSILCKGRLESKE